MGLDILGIIKYMSKNAWAFGSTSHQKINLPFLQESLLLYYKKLNCVYYEDLAYGKCIACMQV